MTNEIKLSVEKRKEMINLIKVYFDKERDEVLGDLGASIILDFITKDLAPEFYNQGIFDAYKFMSEKTEDMLGLEK
jgi:uncharacterized protein (DUF2164 family)